MPIEFYRDGPWEVPDGWVWARLGDVAQVNPSTPFDGLSAELEIPFVPMAAMAEETGVVDLSQRRSVAQLIKGYTRFQTGDVLFAKITPCMENGKSAPIDDLPSGYGAGSTEFHVIRSRVLDPRYLWYWLVRHAFRGNARRNMSGSAGQMRVPVDYIRDTQIAIPPTAEQTRMVVRIDELFTEIADGETALTRARDDLDTWRRALLKAAVTGELTRDWREHNKPNVTGADVVAEAASLKARFGTQTTRRSSAQANDDMDMAGPPELPEGWVWAKLSDFSRASSYGTSVKCSQDANGVAVLRIPNVRAGLIDVHDLKWATVDLDIDEDELLGPGDLLIVRTNGSEDLIGRAAIVDKALQDPTYFASYLIRFRIIDNPSVRRWIAMFFETPVARTWIRKNIASSAGQYNISQSTLMRMPIPVPPDPEMTAVLTTFAATQSIRTDVVADTSIAEKTAPALRQSILKVAFEGRLVEQDRRDEPAETVLARLREGTRQPIPASARRVRRARGTVGAGA